MSSCVETIVVGGGQAGLSASWYLKKAKFEHLILDRGSIGDSWRNRWDSFCLVTPNWCCKLPGFPYDGEDPQGFMLRDEIVDYIERFARSFAPPIHGNVEVNRITASKRSARFELDTSEGIYHARNLIIATGTHQHPVIPAWDTRLPERIKRLHTADYRNPQEFPPGAVLVVGSGQSGCQVVEDLIRAGRRTHLCVGKAGRIPRRYRGHDILEWDEITGYFDLPVDEHPMGHDIRFLAHPHLTGRDGGHSIDLRQLAIDGVELYGKLLDVEGEAAILADDLIENIEYADRFCRQNTADIDEYIGRTGMNAEQPDLVEINWSPAAPRPTLNLHDAGISTVVYATGFHRDFSWIELPVFDDHGYPRYERGVTRLPGLYFVGLHWMYTQGSGLFYGIGKDAEHVVDHISRN